MSDTPNIDNSEELTKNSFPPLDPDPIGDNGREWELGILRLRNLIGQQEMLVEGAKREMSLGAWTYNWTQPHAELQGMIDDLITKLRRAKGEVAALKAHDPLAEMWRELEAYQEQANRDGHGESWRRMCEERTQAAACNAAHAAREFSRESAWSASYAVREAAQMSATAAIAAIRRAKEGQR
jgi:hypothetical protein